MITVNGQNFATIGEAMVHHGWDAGVLRPYVGPDGRSYVTKNGKAEVTQNTPATLRYDDWKQIDTAVIAAAKPRLKFVNDLRARGLQYIIPNGMGKTVLQYQNQGDINAAMISMDGLAQGENDRPQYSTAYLPLPIVHKDWFLSLRELETSRNSNTPLDTTTATMAARKVGEELEQLALGQLATYTFGGGTVYGLKNWTGVLTQTLTAPTAGGWTGKTLLTQLLTMRQTSQQAYYFGPWVLYHSPDWDLYLDQDYSDTKGDNTLRDRIGMIGGISSVMSIDYMTDWDMALVQMTPDVIRMVVGMEVTTLQWDTVGGLSKHFKVMTIQVPQLRADQNGNTGIVYGSV